MPASNESIPVPQRGASLMLSWRCTNRNVLIVGNNTIAAARVLSSLEADATVRLVGSSVGMCEDLEIRIARKEVEWHDRWFDPMIDLENISLAFVCVRDDLTCRAIALACRAVKVPINVADKPELCDFFMTSVHRDQSVQVAISTNGRASQLASRIRRHIAASLPSGLGNAVKEVGMLRQRIRNADPGDEAAARRMKWLAQVCEYWSLEQLANLDGPRIEALLCEYRADEGYASAGHDAFEPLSHEVDQSTHDTNPNEMNSLNEVLSQNLTSQVNPCPIPIKTSVFNHQELTTKKGRIILVGSGPGHPSFLTIAAYNAITVTADVILADKLIPSSILSLIPSETTLHIARKFPGNANAAQLELNTLGLAALQANKTVVRLKQGDPFLFGRGAEEVLYYRDHGYEAEIIPGLSSATAAPLCAGIPLTHRGIASKFLVTTATGEDCKNVEVPNFDSGRTDIFLMAIHRLKELVAELLGKGYPPMTPCAIVERASCPDQRILWGTLDDIERNLERTGGPRPPGLLVVGSSVEVLCKGRLEERKRVEEGFKGNFEGLLSNGKKERDFVLSLHDPKGLF